MVARIKPKFTQQIVWGILVIAIGLAAPARTPAGGLPETGKDLVEFPFNTPATEAEKAYLGIEKAPTFALEDIEAELVLIEIVGVYCPQCHIQFPKMKKLFFRIQKDKPLAGKVKFAAIAMGANSREVAYLRQQFKLPYPVLTDPNFETHKLLGEPRTPFTLLVRRDRKIVYTHLGPIKDMDQFLAQIRKLAG